MRLQDDMFVGGQFAWFTGIVEDINDSEYLNRVKVRCLGYHTTDKGEVPTDKLPWATVMQSTLNAGHRGVGSNHQLVPGSWVIGFFRDGPSAQDPVILGSVASSQSDGEKDIPAEARVSGNTNAVYKSTAGHLIELDNTDGAERINIKHKTGTTINVAADGTVFVNASNTTVDITGNTTIHGNLVVNGTTHSTGDVSTDAGNSPTLATHKHKTTSMDTGTGANSGKTNNSSIPDE